MAIAFIKKLKLDGSPCRKCAEVASRLETAGLMARIDRVIIADEGDPESEGMVLARELGIEAAPFFIVTIGDQRTVYTSYVKLMKEVLEARPSEAEEAIELLANHADLDIP